MRRKVHLVFRGGDPFALVPHFWGGTRAPCVKYKPCVLPYNTPIFEAQMFRMTLPSKEEEIEKVAGKIDAMVDQVVDKTLSGLE